MPNPLPDPETLAMFQCKGQGQSLAGGEGNALRVGDCVFKPVNNPERYNWGCELLIQLPLDGYRISAPIRSNTGSFVHNGWGASTYEPGEHIEGSWDEKIRIGRLFHDELNQLDVTPMPPCEDRWSQAHEIAWQVNPLPESLLSGIKVILEGIFERYRQMKRGNKIIHSDLCGNFLFEDDLDPCIIDFSPTYGSYGYGEAILVVDAIAWEDAPLEIIGLLERDAHNQQNLLRAINFRVIVAALFHRSDFSRFMAEHAAFAPLMNYLTV
jgi:uncharacterized protein (TIGR02569 family)